MRPPEQMIRIIAGKRYDVARATLLAGDDYWDGHNWERNHRQRFLYRTPKGAYFLVTLSRWQGEQDTLEPIDLYTALALYEGPLTEHRVSHEEAFPDVEIEDA